MTEGFVTGLFWFASPRGLASYGLGRDRYFCVWEFIGQVSLELLLHPRVSVDEADFCWGGGDVGAEVG